MASIPEIREEISTLAARQIAIAAEWDGKEMPDDVWSTAKQTDGRLMELRGEFARAKEREDLLERGRGFDREFNTPQNGMIHPSKGSATPVDTGLVVPPSAKGILPAFGGQFTEHEDIKRWLADVAPNGNISERSRIQSPPVALKGMLAQLKLITGVSDTSAGAFILPDQGPFLQPARRPLTVRDLITVLTTTSDTIEYARVTTETNAAAPVAEATATSGVTGTKPESDLVFEKVTTTVKTIAHWIAVTKRALADANQLRGYIDSFLRYGLEEELEDQIVVGTGVGENFTGIFNTTGTQTQAWDTDILTTTRKARTKVRTIGRAVPTAYLLNPADWETIDLLKDGTDNYYFGGPMQLGTPRLWGLPVIESEAVVAGTGLVGDFRQAVLWDREQATITATDSHADFFIRNLVAILAEMRAAFGVLKPNVFVEIDLTAA